MTVPWILLLESMKTGISHINSLDSVKFPLLLSRIITAIQKNVDHPFSQEELQKLEKSLNLENEDLKIMLATLIEITQKSNCFLMKPTVLHEELIEKLNFDSDKAEAFVKFWTENTKLDFNDLQNRKTLQGLSWELNLETATDCDLKKTVPTSLLQLQVKDNKDKDECITIEMNEQELLNMYNQIENIQSYLDNINK